MTKNPFVGTWRLITCEARSPDGQVSYLWGKDAVGYIMYTEDGYMSVVIMSANRPKFTSEDLKGGSTDEKASAAETYISYCGKYEVQGDTVTHHIEGCSFPNWTGVDQKRTFEFHGNRLFLSTAPFLQNGVEQTSHLIWERPYTQA